VQEVKPLEFAVYANSLAQLIIFILIVIGIIAFSQAQLGSCEAKNVSQTFS